MFFINGKTITQWLNVYIQLKINTIYLHIIYTLFQIISLTLENSVFFQSRLS